MFGYNPDFSSTTVSEPLAYRSAVAGAIHATHTAMPEKLEPFAREKFPLGFDAVFECSGEPAAMNQALRNNCDHAALELFLQNPRLPRAMHTHTFAPEDCADAFRKLDTYSGNIIKAIVRFA